MALRRRVLFGVLPLLVATTAGGAVAAAKVFPDRTGDTRGGPAPDIASVTLSHTASAVTFRVRFASAPPLRANAREQWVDMLLVGIDVPPLGPPPSSPGGEWPGADFALGTHGPSRTGLLVRLDDRRSAPPVRFAIVAHGRTLSFSVPRRALGNPRRFAFTVTAAREGATEAQGGGFDVAPDRGTYRYSLSD